MHFACCLILHTGLLMHTLYFPRWSVSAESSRIKFGTSTEVIVVKAFCSSRLSRNYCSPCLPTVKKVSKSQDNWLFTWILTYKHSDTNVLTVVMNSDKQLVLGDQLSIGWLIHFHSSLSFSFSLFAFSFSLWGPGKFTAWNLFKWASLKMWQLNRHGTQRNLVSECLGYSKHTVWSTYNNQYKNLSWRTLSKKVGVAIVGWGEWGGDVGV